MVMPSFMDKCTSYRRVYFRNFLLSTLSLIIVDTHFRDTFFYKPDSIKPNFLMGSIHVLYFILLSMAQAHATYWGKLRKCGLKGMSQFLSDLLHEPNTCVLPSGQGTLVAP